MLQFLNMKKVIKKLVHSLGLDIRKHQEAIHPLDFLKNHDVRTVMDIGANVGQFAEEVRAILPQAQIYSFEPITSVYAELLKNRKGDSKWKGFNYALGNEEGVQEILVSPYSPSSSLLPKTDLLNTAFPHTQGGAKEKITISKLDTIAKKLNLEGKILVKMDVQGFEQKVIEGGLETLSKATVVLTETSFFPIYEGQPLFEDIYSALTKLGFTYRGSLHAKYHPTTHEILFEDSIFVKKS